MNGVTGCIYKRKIRSYKKSRGIERENIEVVWIRKKKTNNDDVIKKISEIGIKENWGKGRKKEVDRNY